MHEALQESFLELSARERARALLDSTGQRELLGPFDRITSTWLTAQDIVPQSDDGAFILQGKLHGQPAVVMALEGKFQGGSIGEISGSKLRCALELIRRDAERGRKWIPILLLETGGVRLQEANLGLELISEIQAEIVALRKLVPVIALIAGPVGCFGGMSIAAALCSYLIMTRQGRYGLNGPEVIEQEAGRQELDSSDRRLIWNLIGGEQRFACGFVDAIVEDHTAAIRNAIHTLAAQGIPPLHRSQQVDHYLPLFTQPAAASLSTPQAIRDFMHEATS